MLQQRVESVVAAANDHLRVMSDGKLVLIAHDEAEGRARKAGPGLRAVDLRTDKERPTGTFSGGETFCTSLALGLVGVVTAEAGGVVSHIDEMKNRIPERITVRRDDDRGPSRLVVVG